MPNSDLKVLGEKVRKERKLAGLTQEQLAERCHVSTKHMGFASFPLRASMARGQRSAPRLGFSFGGRSAFACSAAAFPALSWSLMDARPTEPRSAICSSFAS